jgi:23S rRNA (guanine2535-N1)-methyltransferase
MEQILMVYRFALERHDFEDFAAGRVFIGLPGHPAFPIRLTSEIFQRCLNIRRSDGLVGPCQVYDPCCGGGYLLATLAFLHWPDIREIVASDINPTALEVAAQNLGMATLEGMQRRIEHIQAMIEQFDKLSHKEAYDSAQRLKARLLESLTSHAIAVRTFNVNIMTDQLTDYFAAPVDLVITDIPYGSHSSWLGLPEDARHEPSWYMLQSLLDILTPHSLVAIASNKQQKISHDRYRRVDHFQIGKRRVVILKPNPL